MKLCFQITYSAIKEFVDAQGVTQVQSVAKVTHRVNNRKYSYIIEELRPFTTYTVNVTAVPQTSEYRPPAKITVTTQMAGKYSAFCVHIHNSNSWPLHAKGTLLELHYWIIEKKWCHSFEA